jgi:hypothetical protein
MEKKKLAVGLMAITNEFVELGMRNLVRRS